MNQPIFFVAAGCSARALLESIRRVAGPAGAIDQFCDRDTLSIADRAVRIECFSQIPGVVRDVVADGTTAAVLWAGGIENHVDAIDDLTGNPNIILVGSSAAAIRKVRDPFWIEATLSLAGLPHLQVLADSPAVVAGGRWIVKSIRSGGGIHVWWPEALDLPKTADLFWQEFVEGPVFGATFLATKNSARLIGVCRHLSGFSSDRPFRYQGSVGPVTLAGDLSTQLVAIAECLSRAAGLRGWFGVDIAIRNGHVMLLEVNPRYTASMEIIDGRLVDCLFHSHLHSSLPELWPANKANRILSPEASPVAGKLVVYNDQSLSLEISSATSDQWWDAAQHPSRSFRDIPCAGTVIPPGGPVCTVWAEAATEADVLQQLSCARQVAISQLPGGGT